MIVHCNAQRWRSLHGRAKGEALLQKEKGNKVMITTATRISVRRCCGGESLYLVDSWRSAMRARTWNAVIFRFFPSPATSPPVVAEAGTSESLMLLEIMLHTRKQGLIDSQQARSSLASHNSLHGGSAADAKVVGVDVGDAAARGHRPRRARPQPHAPARRAASAAVRSADGAH